MRTPCRLHFRTTIFDFFRISSFEGVYNGLNSSLRIRISGSPFARKALVLYIRQFSKISHEEYQNHELRNLKKTRRNMRYVDVQKSEVFELPVMSSPDTHTKKCFFAFFNISNSIFAGSGTNPG